MPWPDPPLTDGELTLRRPRPEDADAAVPLLRDPEIPRWTRVPADYTPAMWEEFVRRAAEEAAAGTGLSLLAVRDGAIVGSVGLHHLREGAGEIGCAGYRDTGERRAAEPDIRPGTYLVFVSAADPRRGSPGGAPPR